MKPLTLGIVLVLVGVATLFGFNGHKNRQRTYAYMAGYFMGYDHAWTGHFANCGYRYYPDRKDGKRLVDVGIGNEVIYGSDSAIVPFLRIAGIKRRTEIEIEGQPNDK